jgi:hypothetical protein
MTEALFVHFTLDLLVLPNTNQYSQMTRNQKIQAAKDMTEANIEHHRIHLEDGYVEATFTQAINIFGHEITVKADFFLNQNDSIQIWGINKRGELYMI